MKLYVWDRVLRECEYGMAFALAESADEARRLIIERFNRESAGDSYDDIRERFAKEMQIEPTVHETAAGFYIWGSD